MLLLFPGERLISQSTNGDVNLTTHRISQQYKQWGRSYDQSILLEQITSCKKRYHTKKWIVALGALAIVIGFVKHEKTIAIIAGAICFYLYWKAKKKLLIISSSNTTIKISIDGMSQEKIQDFINKLEQAKSNRIVA
jgi:hypothetical protein